MDRQRPVSRFALMVVAWIVFLGPGSAPSRGDDAPPIGELQPYLIRAHVTFDPSSRIDATRRGIIVADWLGMVRRFVGTAWNIQVVDEESSATLGRVESVEPEAMKVFAAKADKAWFIEVRAEGRGLTLSGREYDTTTGRLGQVHHRSARFVADAPRRLLDLSLAVFAPLAEVGKQENGGVTFQVRGGSLPPASPLGAIAGVGTIFRVFRIFAGTDGKPPEVREVPFSYFQVEKIEGAAAQCVMIRGVSDPLSSRFARKNTLIALGLKAASEPTRLRFVARTDKRPASGYLLTARGVGESRPSEVGTTDRDGRIVLPPDFAPGLVILRLMAGNAEPMVEFPIMPGETSEERVIPVETRPATLALEARLDALRDAIIDVVASRSRLELRMKARADGEDWDGLAEAIQEFRKLAPRDRFVAQLDKILSDGERQEAETKSLVLTKNARSQLEDTKALIGRYLDDDKARAYDELLQQGRVEAKDRAKEKEKEKTRPATPAPIKIEP